MWLSLRLSLARLLCPGWVLMRRDRFDAIGGVVRTIQVYTNKSRHGYHFVTRLRRAADYAADFWHEANDKVTAMDPVLSQNVAALTVETSDK